MQTKFCGSCQLTLPVDSFARNRTKADGLNYRCRACSKSVNATRYARDKERIHAQQKAYRESHVEQERERHAAYQQANRDKVNAKGKRWRARHAHRSADIAIESARANPKSYLRGLYSAYMKRATKLGLATEISQETFEEMVLFGTCYLCGDEPDTDATGLVRLGVDRVDNFVGYTLANSRPCCTQCNKMKNVYPLDKFLERVKMISDFQSKIAG